MNETAKFCLRYRTEELNEVIENFTKGGDWIIQPNDPHGYTHLHFQVLAEIDPLKFASRTYACCMGTYVGRRILNVPTKNLETGEVRSFLIEFTEQSTFKVII